MSLREMLSDYWYAFQQELFPRLESELGPMGERYELFVAVLELVRVEALLPYFRGHVPPVDRRFRRGYGAGEVCIMRVLNAYCALKGEGNRGPQRRRKMDAFNELKRFAEVCEEVATEHGIPICVTVVDMNGLPVLLHRMPNAGVLSLEMADRKAYTSVVFNIESRALFDAVQPGNPGYTLTSSSNRLIAFGGGSAVRLGHELYGVGISGGPTDTEDMMILAGAQDRYDNADAVWAERVT